MRCSVELARTNKFRIREDCPLRRHALGLEACPATRIETTTEVGATEQKMQDSKQSPSRCSHLIDSTD